MGWAKKSWKQKGKMKKFPKKIGIRVAENGKNEKGGWCAAARIGVAFARFEVALARFEVGIGSEIWPDFSTERAVCGEFQAGSPRLTRFWRLFGLI